MNKEAEGCILKIDCVIGECKYVYEMSLIGSFTCEDLEQFYLMLKKVANSKG